tara:strand:- start:186 stop:512 length:327 start_codon:yes stop_codon:yes gene_type:complete
MKNILDKNSTSEAYKLIRKASWHLANETENTASLQPELKKKLYYDIQSNLKKGHLIYSKETQTATQIKSFDMLEKYCKVKKTPKNISNLVPAPTVAKTKKPTTKRGRI